MFESGPTLRLEFGLEGALFLFWSFEGALRSVWRSTFGIEPIFKGLSPQDRVNLSAGMGGLLSYLRWSDATNTWGEGSGSTIQGRILHNDRCSSRLNDFDP
ncbi:hypothetical protein BH23PLA1_BH23PLA1_42630 [soil metagenome]